MKYEKELEKKSKLVRRKILEMVVSAKNGHIGGTLSCVDILVALYYGKILRIDPKKPRWKERDRFILSKGHSGIALYVILADLGFFDIPKLNTFGNNDTILGGHPDINIPGIEANTGSLGHGLGIGAGFALAAKIDKIDSKVIVLLGDGECYEGSIWEAAMFSSHHRLTNLVAVVDRNQLCATDFTEDCNRLEPFSSKWHSFGWDVAVINGHSFREIFSVFNKFRDKKFKRPLAVIANTRKGKGISFMENRIHWHHGIPAVKQIEIAMKELLRDEDLRY